jgi:hypothetical protein
MTNASGIIGIVKDIYSKIKGNELSGFLVIIIGLLVGTPAANLDMSSHWLSIPETFFSPSHAGVYTGVAIVIFGSILVLRNAYGQRSNHKDSVEYIHKSHFYEHLIPHRWFFRNSVLPLSIKLIFYGVIITILSGPFDLTWHTVFGLDGLLSPSHATLRIGDALSAIGALLGIISTHPVMGSATRSKQYFSLYPIFVIVAILPVIFASRGFISMVTLPFSNTYNFQWNPDPLAAAIIATVGFPFFISLLLYLSFRLANFNTIILWNKDSRSEVKRPLFKFGIITIVGTALIATAVFSVILPNIYLHQTIPLYIFNIIPIIGADILLTMGFSNTSNANLAKITAELSAGAILGLLFFTLQYPFIAYTYNEVLKNPEVIGPTNVHIVYLKTLELLPWIIAPSIIFGIFGIMVGSRLVSRYAPQQLVRTK